MHGQVPEMYLFQGLWQRPTQFMQPEQQAPTSPGQDTEPHSYHYRPVYMHELMHKSFIGECRIIHRFDAFIRVSFPCSHVYSAKL